ncbi:hypothetical protein K8R61_01465 [bacterium]|nr:hypothetical protein [bacterium]
MITKKEIKEIMKLKGKVRGVTLRTDAEYILNKKGEKGLERLQREILKTGEDIKYKNIKNVDWYPIGWRIVSLLVIREIFDWGDKEIKEMGHSAPKNSFIVKIIMRYFISLEKTFKEASKYWKKHYSVGRLVSDEIDLKKKYVKIKIEDFKGHPILCTFLEGYFSTIVGLMVKEKKIKAIEENCPYKGDSFHKITIKW